MQKTAISAAGHRLKLGILRLCSYIIDFIFPRLCIACSSTLVRGEEHICTLCLFRLPYTNHFGHNDNVASTRMAELGTPIPAASLLNYKSAEVVHKIIHDFKYKDNKEIALMMGRIMGKSAQSWPEYADIDFLIPVPIHKTKANKRGYNQSEWLCRGISAVWGTPIATNALIKRKSTDSQITKSRLERKEILSQNVFALTDTKFLENKNLLLIDDVFTTGSTTAACASLLINIPGTRVMVFTLAIA